MKTGFAIFVLGIAAFAVPTLAQNTSPLPLPPPVEKELAARASNVTEVTLGKNMLAFASKFMKGKDQDEEATRHLIEGLDGIYVRSYEFDKEGQYSMEEIQKLRQYFETAEWSPVVRETSKKGGETTDVMVKLVNGETHGMFILSAEPKDPRARPHGRLGQIAWPQRPRRSRRRTGRAKQTPRQEHLQGQRQGQNHQREGQGR